MSADEDNASEGGSLAALHPDWRRAWGPSIQGEGLRAAIEADPRLRGRILATIAESHDLAIGAEPRLDRTAGAVARALGEDRIGFQRLCGLAHIGRRIATATNRDDYGVLAKAFGPDRLAAAVRISSDLPEREDDHGYDTDQLVPAVERLGRAVLGEWTATLPRGAADWITMMLPRGGGEPGGSVGTARAIAIVEGAAEEVRAEDRRGTGRRSLAAPTRAASRRERAA